MGSSGEAEESVILVEEEAEAEAEDPSGRPLRLVGRSGEYPLPENDVDEVLDEECDLRITFCRQADVMLHARYDCPACPFECAEREPSCPLGRNAETCCQCYCYVCDKPADECQDWVTPSLCHCNAHNKSSYWKDQRNLVFTGSLGIFNLEPTEIDADVQRAGALLPEFMHSISIEYNKYLFGERISSDHHRCFCPPKLKECCQHLFVVYSYTAVFEYVTAFLNQAEKEPPKAEAIMLLGAAREIALHKDPAPFSQNLGPSGSMKQAVPLLMRRITSRLQKLLILNDFPKALHNKLVNFYQSIPFPSHCYPSKISLSFMPWDHGLLSSILKGQNVSSQGTGKEKNEQLWETVSVIEARIERMEDHQRYMELIHYLKAVKCRDSQWLQKQGDKVPFYLCQRGDLANAAQALFDSCSTSCCAACRLTPAQFAVYLKIFRTGRIPSGKNLEDSAPPWISVGTPLELAVLLRQTLRLLHWNQSLYKDPRCWSSVIKIFSSHPILGEDGRLTAVSLKEPTQKFQLMILQDSCYVVKELSKNASTNVVFSEECSKVLQLESSMIFIIQAARQMIFKEYLSLNSFLEIILALGNNFWALQLLFESLDDQEDILCHIVHLILSDLHYREAELLELWARSSTQEVGQLLCFFLTSGNRILTSVGIAIINIIAENLHKCPWAKQVGQFLSSSTKPFIQTAYEASRFIAMSQALPEAR